MPSGIYIRTDEYRRSLKRAMNRPEVIEANRKRHLGKKFSEETKKKISNGNKGKKRSIETKNRISQAKLGEKNPQWIGGYSRIYATNWTRTLRISIRERDDYTCKICGKKQGDRAFSIHHIDYDKMNSDPKNLITLCMRCHIKTNFNRRYWINYFLNTIIN